MSAKDTYHAEVKAALVKDGWTVTHDPYTLAFGPTDVFVDFAAERLLAVEKGPEKILVEVKSFRGASEVRDLELALGQYILYRVLMKQARLDQPLFLAVPEPIYQGFLSESATRVVLGEVGVHLVVFDPVKEVIVLWQPWTTTGGSSGN
jgi:hypothetical protein